MASSASIIDPFHRALNAALTDLVNDRMISLARGSASRTETDTATTAEKYAAQVSYIQAIHDVLDKCEELEREQYGKRAGQPEES